MPMCSSQEEFFSFYQKEKSFRCYVAQPEDKKKVEKVVAAWESSSVWWITAASQLPRSSAGLVQFYYDKAASSLKFELLFVFPGRVVCLDATERKRTYLADHRYSFLGFLTGGRAELWAEGAALEAEKSTSFYGPTSSCIEPQKKFIHQ